MANSISGNSPVGGASYPASVPSAAGADPSQQANAVDPSALAAAAGAAGAADPSQAQAGAAAGGQVDANTAAVLSALTGGGAAAGAAGAATGASGQSQFDPSQMSPAQQQQLAQALGSQFGSQAAQAQQQGQASNTPQVGSDYVQQASDAQHSSLMSAIVDPKQDALRKMQLAGVLAAHRAVKLDAKSTAYANELERQVEVARQPALSKAELKALETEATQAQTELDAAKAARKSPEEMKALANAHEAAKAEHATALEAEKLHPKAERLTANATKARQAAEDAKAAGAQVDALTREKTLATHALEGAINEKLPESKLAPFREAVTKAEGALDSARTSLKTAKQVEALETKATKAEELAHLAKQGGKAPEEIARLEKNVSDAQGELKAARSAQVSAKRVADLGAKATRAQQALEDGKLAGMDKDELGKLISRSTKASQKAGWTHAVAHRGTISARLRKSPMLNSKFAKSIKLDKAGNAVAGGAERLSGKLNLGVRSGLQYGFLGKNGVDFKHDASGLRRMNGQIIASTDKVKGSDKAIFKASAKVGRAAKAGSNWGKNIVGKVKGNKAFGRVFGATRNAADETAKVAGKAKPSLFAKIGKTLSKPFSALKRVPGLGRFSAFLAKASPWMAVGATVLDAKKMFSVLTDKNASFKKKLLSVLATGASAVTIPLSVANLNPATAPISMAADLALGGASMGLEIARDHSK